MLDLEAIRAEKRPDRERKAVKTFLRTDLHLRVKRAAAYAGCHDYEIVEALIETHLPETIINGETRT